MYIYIYIFVHIRLVSEQKTDVHSFFSKMFQGDEVFSDPREEANALRHRVRSPGWIFGHLGAGAPFGHPSITILGWLKAYEEWDV